MLTVELSRLDRLSEQSVVWGQYLFDLDSQTAVWLTRPSERALSSSGDSTCLTWTARLLYG